MSPVEIAHGTMVGLIFNCCCVPHKYASNPATFRMRDGKLGAHCMKPLINQPNLVYCSRCGFANPGIWLGADYLMMKSDPYRQSGEM